MRRRFCTLFCMHSARSTSAYFEFETSYAPEEKAYEKIPHPTAPIPLQNMQTDKRTRTAMY